MDGYRRMILTRRVDGGKVERKTIYLHRLVALTFVPNPGGLPEVDHDDMDKGNNRATNLVWVTHRRNMELARLKKDWATPMRNNPKLSKPVIETDAETGKETEWPSVAEFSRVNGGGRNLCPNVCTAIQTGQVAYGSRWRFKLKKHQARIMREDDARIEPSTNLPAAEPMAVALTADQLESRMKSDMAQTREPSKRELAVAMVPAGYDGEGDAEKARKFMASFKPGFRR